MATKKIKELRNLSKAEMTTRLREVEAELFQAKMQQKTGQLGDSAKLWRLRKDIARLKMLSSTAAAAKGEAGKSESKGK